VREHGVDLPRALSALAYELGVGAHGDDLSADASRVRVADYLVSSAAFTTNAIPQYGLQTVNVDFRVSVNPTTSRDVYELKDSIVARNYTPRCVAASCPVTSVP
jgi:hypothetical protein